MWKLISMSFVKQNTNKKERNKVLIKYCLKTTSKISKRQKLDKIYNEYDIYVVGCSLTKGKVGMRSALRYYKVLFLSFIKEAFWYTCSLSKGLL